MNRDTGDQRDQRDQERVEIADRQEHKQVKRTDRMMCKLRDEGKTGEAGGMLFTYVKR